MSRYSEILELTQIVKDAHAELLAKIHAQEILLRVLVALLRRNDPVGETVVMNAMEDAAKRVEDPKLHDAIEDLIEGLG